VPIGFKYICELMLEHNILIGGEESGGFGTSLYLPERDAIVSALFLAELMAWHGRSLGELLGALHSEPLASITMAGSTWTYNLNRNRRPSRFFPTLLFPSFRSGP